MEGGGLREQTQAAFVGTTVGAALTTTTARGCSAVYTGVGVVTVTLDKALPSTEGQIAVETRTATSFCNVTHTSDTVKVLTFIDDAHAPIETAFCMRAIRFAYGLT